MVALLHALVTEGFRVLVCGPTAESVEAILQSYRETRDPDFAGDHNFALWTDQYAKSGSKCPAPEEEHETSSEIEAKSGKKRGWAGDEDDPENRLMQDCLVQQSTFAAHEKNQDVVGFNRVRSSVASILTQTKDHEASRVGELYLAYLKKKRKDREERQIFSNQEYNLNLFLLQNQLQMIFATCNDSHHNLLVQFFTPDYLVIDDASACSSSDLATPIAAFKESIKTVILVGDQKQRPPTAMSSGQNWALNEMNENIFHRVAVDSMKRFRSDNLPQMRSFNPPDQEE